LTKPLLWEDKHDANQGYKISDVKNYYNPNKYSAPRAYSQQRSQSLAAIDPKHPTGLEPAPKDPQYEVPQQLTKPLLWEDKHDANQGYKISDVKNYYNPNKYSAPRAYSQQKSSSMAQIDPLHPTGLEPAPKDPQYEVPQQLTKPNNIGNAFDMSTGYRNSDLINWYNPNKYNNPTAYAQKKEEVKTALA